MSARRPDALHVLIATPYGKHGKGGIDRMMDVIDHQARANADAPIQLRYLITRGHGPLIPSIFTYFVPAIFYLIYFILIWRVDVFHVNIVQRGSTLRKLTLCYIARLASVPYVLHLHGSGYRQYWSSAGRFLSRRIREIFNGAAQVLVLGQVWADYVGEQASAARISILPNATFAPKRGRLHRNGEPAHILFLGRLGERKGVPELIQALTQLGATPSWRATLAGDGQVEQARRQIGAAGLSGQVEIPGWVGPDEVERLLASADILVLPSYNENLPLSVIEGMAHGLAVVTTPVGAVPDIVAHGETGLLCPPGDPDALAQALALLVDDAELRSRLGRAARAFHAEHLNVDTYFARLLSIWGAASLHAHR
jgi:glycosyltransferase involved in cell wall biosynthesis